MNTPENVQNRADVSAMLEKYKQTGGTDKALRNDIVMSCMHIVRFAVISTRNMFRRFTSDEDVTNEAVLALMSAVESFDPEKKVKFETFASIKIRGAIIDYIRRMDDIPRSVRRFARDYDAAYSALYISLDREPTADEIAAHLKISPEKMNALAHKSAASQALSFEELVFGGFDITDSSQAEDNILLEERKTVLAQAVKKLNEKERTVITLYYYEKLKYSEIAAVLDISESRVCQIHSKASKRLREYLEEYMSEE